MWRLWWLYCAKCFSHLIHAIQNVLVYNSREFHALSEYVRILEYIIKKTTSSGFFQVTFSWKYHHFVKKIFVTENQNNKVLNTSFDAVWCALSYETEFTFSHLTDVTNRSHRLGPCFLSQIDRMENLFSNMRYFQYYQTIVHWLYYWWWKNICCSSYRSWENKILLKIVEVQKMQPRLTSGAYIFIMDHPIELKFSVSS